MLSQKQENRADLTPTNDPQLDDCVKTDESFLVAVTAKDLHQLKQHLFAVVNYSRATRNLQTSHKLTDAILTEYNIGILEAVGQANRLLEELTSRSV